MGVCVCVCSTFDSDMTIIMVICEGQSSSHDLAFGAELGLNPNFNIVSVLLHPP